MTKLLLSVLGPDRPGMVAAVTKSLVDGGFNLEDTSMTRLGGSFTMLLLLESAADIADADVSRIVDSIPDRSSLRIDVNVADRAVTPGSGERWAVSLYGADQPGIVAAITGYLAEVGANIEDLSTRLTGSDDEPVYTMLLDVILPAGVEGGDVSIELDRRATALGVACHARIVDVDTF